MREETADSITSIAWLRVPARRMFKTKAAAQYLGLHPQTLRRLTDKGRLKALTWMGNASTRSRNWTGTSARSPSGTMAPAKGPRHPMENVMGFKKVKDHAGRTRIELSKY